MNCIMTNFDTLTYLITNPDEIQSLGKMSFTDFTLSQIFFCICNPKQRRRKGMCQMDETQFNPNSCVSWAMIEKLHPI